MRYKVLACMLWVITTSFIWLVLKFTLPVYNELLLLVATGSISLAAILLSYSSESGIQK